MDYPGNSYKLRGISKEPPVPSLSRQRAARQYYYVRIEYSVWPEIYGKQLPIPFPNRDSAIRFALNNCNAIKPHTRVFAEDGTLVANFTHP
jgi:hypothetical protein